MPLTFFYTTVQKSQKWPKTQIKGGGPALIEYWMLSAQETHEKHCNCNCNWQNLPHLVSNNLLFRAKNAAHQPIMNFIEMRVHSSFTDEQEWRSVVPHVKCHLLLGDWLSDRADMAPDISEYTCGFWSFTEVEMCESQGGPNPPSHYLFDVLQFL